MCRPLAGLEVVICITEGIPVRDMIRTRDRMQGTRTVLLGPNCPGRKNARRRSVTEAPRMDVPGTEHNPLRVAVVGKRPERLLCRGGAAQEWAGGASRHA